jgi:hypothetical protein
MLYTCSNSNFNNHFLTIKQDAVMELSIILTTKIFNLKSGTKTVYQLEKEETETISEKTYKSYVDSCKYFRRLGGTETVQYGYTSAGYRAEKIASKSPCKTLKVVRNFSLKYN